MKLCNFPKCRNLINFTSGDFCPECINKKHFRSQKLSDISEEQKKKVKARGVFKYFIKKGKITRQKCSILDCQDIGEGHHEDYNKPLEVKWLCRFHHMDYHSKNQIRVVN